MNTTIYTWKDCRIDEVYYGQGMGYEYKYYYLFVGENWLALTQTEHKNWKTYIKGVLKARIKTKANQIEIIRKEITRLEVELASNGNVLNKYAKCIEQLEAEGKISKRK